MYAQKIEGDAWVGEKLDPGKIEKMSGMYATVWPGLLFSLSMWYNCGCADP